MVPLCETCHGLAHHVRMSTQALTTQALAEKRSRGERTGTVPYGWRLATDGVHLEEHPEEVGTVAMVRKLRNNGVSIRAIAALLDAMGAPTRGSRWHATTVVRLLERVAI
jgi:hypothetical protein